MIKVIKYDTWGNVEDGFNVNDAFTVDTIDPYDVVDDTQLIKEYFGDDAEVNNSGDFGDGREEIVSISNGKPLGALVWDGE